MTTTNTRSEDWIRTQTWDLPAELKPYLARVTPDPGQSLPTAVAARMALPSAEAMPAPLRKAVMRWLRDQAKAN